jgi:hypothetical protein
VQLARLVVTLFPQPIWFLIFDDTFIYRTSKKAPGSGIHHQHGNKANRPQYKWQWVRYRSAVCLAKFMQGHKVRAVWMQFED